MFRNTILLALFAVSCAQSVGDVDRTQPNRIKKSLFDGEWYLQKTTFDVPYSAGFTFTGETSELERVRWEIQEQYLIAYRTYETVENSNKPTLLPDVEFKGAPVAAYAIESHFDVTREYNPLTGEETNVLYENTVDRPWYERAYVRVNWSTNLVASFAFLDDQVSQSPIAYYVQDRDDEDRLLIGVKNGDAGWTDHQDWEEIANLDSADYLDIVDTIFANPQVDIYEDEFGDLVEYPACWFYTASDCQPARVKIRNSFLKVTDAPYEAMAYPDNEVARDADGNPIRDEYGDAIRIPYFDRFGYFRVERDYYDRDRERTETGRTYLIDRWGIWKNAPECKSADGSYSSCEVRPIVYHLSPGFPEELKETARLVVSQWNGAFKETVNHLKYGGQRDLSQVEDVYLLEENTYAAGSDRGQRIGDVRYSFIYYVPEPQAVGPLGYGPSAADPLTGQIISGNAYVYGAALESWSAFAADVVQLINGGIDPDDFIEGEDIRHYVARVRGDYASNAGEADRDPERTKEWLRSDGVKKSRDKQRAIGKRGMRLDHAKVRAKLAAIRETPFEERLLNDEIVRALAPATRGRGEGLAGHLSAEQRRKISPANWGTTGQLRALRDARRLKIGKASLTLASFADDGVMGLAESLVGQDWHAVRDSVYASVFRSTAEHEVGHTLGLRHNFAGSFDALNYHDQYWQLRGSDPQPFQEPTAEQTSNRMREYQYASIMDYSAQFNADIHGLGRYDRAAILFGYGQLVEVFEAPPEEPIAELVGLDFALHQLRHYTALPRLFGGDWQNMMRRRWVPYSTMIAQMTGQSQSREALVEVPYRFCSDEYESAIPECNTWDEGADPWEIVNNAAKAYENYYIFNSFARDAREVEPWNQLDRVYYRYFIHPQVQYQNWVFRAFDLESLWEYSLRYDYEYYGVEDAPFDQALDGNLSGAMASRAGLNMLARVIQAPEPGAYYLDTDENVFYNYDYATDVPLCPPNESRDDCSDLNVPLGEGKYAFSLYDGSTGYYFFERLHVVGSFYDKLAAIQTITSPETNFLGVDTDANLTSYAISMHLYFPEEVTRLIGGSATEGYATYAGVAKNQTLEYRDMFAPKAEYAGKAAIDPATSFTIELYSAWLGMAFLNANFDNSFNDSMRIWEEGSGEGLIPELDDPTRIARFTHPRTGRTFVAVRSENTEQFSPAFDLITRTASLATSLSDPDLRDYYIEFNTSIIDSLRGMYELYGKLYF